MSAPTSFRSRRIACAIAWIGCIPAVLGYALLTIGALSAVGKGGSLEGGDTLKVALVYLAFVCGWFSWYVLFTMSRSWLKNKPLPPLLPLAGTAAATIALVPMGWHWWPIALASPGVALALYLVAWHVMPRSASNAHA